jgi:hypothetical protein
MLIAPAHNSAKPPVTTKLDDPSVDSPAVNAKGTVNPSDNPMMLHHTKCQRRALILLIPHDLWTDQMPLIVTL